MPLKHLAHYAKLSLRMLICPLPPKGVYIRPVCCLCCSVEESVGISGLCIVCAALWRRALVYQACLLSVLLCGGERWIPLKKHQKRMNTFHHRCIRTILGITCTQQWEEHISSKMMGDQWGDEETITTKLMRRCL